MGYTDMDSTNDNIMWFAVDRNSRIAAFTTTTMDNLPEFVCKSKDINQKLYNYFMYHLPDSTCGEILEKLKTSSQEEDCVLLIGKGVTCFGMSNSHEYHKIAETRDPITIDMLDDEIKELMKSNKLEADFIVDKIYPIR